MSMQAKATSWFYFILTITGVLAFRWSFAEPYVIPSGSMQPTLQIGDRIGVVKTAYDLKIPFTDLAIAQVSDPRRGDVIVFRHPGDHTTFLVKRLIGLPGDHISVHNGRISVNGESARYHDGCRADSRRPENPDTHCEELPDATGKHAARFLNDGQRMTESEDYDVPAQHYFFMGDNRDNSSDSRSWGFVPRRNIQGKAVAVLFSLRENGVPELTRAGIVIP